MTPPGRTSSLMTITCALETHVDSLRSADQTRTVDGVALPRNTLTSHAFTQDRIAVLELLAAQAAISLENTRLYGDLREREAKVRRLVDSNIIGIFIWDLEGRVIDANEAFLHMVGHSRDDLSSGRMRWTELTPNEWSDATEQS